MTALSNPIFAPHPFGTEITGQQLLETFKQCRLWEDRYRLLIGLAKKLPNLPDELKQQKIEISGCENRVWLGHQALIENRSIENSSVENSSAENSSDANRLHFYGDSEGRIVKGLLAFILAMVEGKTPEQVLQTNLTGLFQQAGLAQQLSASRLNGVKALINSVQAIALSYQN
ncbi:MAG: SufE family protein [Enterobacteriaceae bacterium]|jgi:cysteine desulfuration protein SufE|nr:SufE family protein [Enterobacteriaceae bacterium]